MAGPGIISAHGAWPGTMKIIIWWAYDSDAGRIKHYRVDKMLHIRISEEEREGREHFQKLDMADYTKKSFGMFGGEEQTVKLLVDNSLVGVILDRFGKDMMLIPADEGHFTVNVDVHVSGQFPGMDFFAGGTGENTVAGGRGGTDEAGGGEAD